MEGRNKQMINEVFKLAMAICIGFWTMVATYQYNVNNTDKSISAALIALVLAVSFLAFSDRGESNG